MASSINDWNELLPELLEKILSKVEDKETALSARLVNSAWKTEIEKRMEKACLETWTKWRSPRVTDFPPIALFPKIDLWKEDDEHIATASLGAGKGKDLMISNPFPTNSFILSGGLTRKMAVKANLISAELVPAQAFFEKHGAKVLNLQIQGVFYAKDFHGILTWFPNLKGVSIPIGLDRIKDSAFSKETPLPLLPNLEHLEFFKMQPTKASREFVNWIMDAYGANLVSLNLAGSNFFSLKENKKKATQAASEFHPRYQKLAYLKVYNPGGSFFKSPACFPQLTHLVLSQIEALISLKGLRVIMDFIDKCAATLIHLHLEVIIGDLKNQDLAVLEKNPPQIFPKLTSFVTRSTFGSPDEATLIKRAFLSRFPALTRLEFHYQPDTIAVVVKGFRIDEKFKHQMKLELLGERFWDYAPRLQKIFVCEMDNWRKVSELFTITKNW